MPEVQYRKAKKAIDDQRPFLGLRSFEEKNKSQFGGRDEEIKELFGLDENSLLTVIFGKSGIGKTSLIKAGLIPELRQNFYFPIYVRIDYCSSRTPLEQVRKIVFDEMKKKDSGVPEIGDATLWEYFHNVNLLDDLVTPVLILDQFEEVFTLGGTSNHVLQFLIQLADLAENRIPLTVQGEYQKLNKTVPTHYAEQPYRVILSLREDYLARLEELKKYMPSIMTSRFRVVQMTIGQALEAAIKPGKGLIDEKVALEIIKKLPGISLNDFDALDKKGIASKGLKVEPFLLSLVCDRINEKRIEKGLKKISVDLVSKFNVTDVIYSFYNTTIAPFGDNVERAIEDCLLTEAGFRKLQALEEFQRLYEISDEAVDQLVDARILRKEIRDGVDYVELIHDVLAPVIKGKRSKRARFLREEKRQEAIIQAKKRQRTRLIRISGAVALAIGLILATTGYFALENKNEKDRLEKHNKNMRLARDLILESQIVGGVGQDTEKGALVARLAYLIYLENKNEDGSENMYETDFYNAMYVALKNNGFPFIENKYDSNIQFVAKVNEDEVYYGLGDGTVLINYPNSFSKADSVLYKFDRGSIVPMDFHHNEGKNLLAVAREFDSISIYSLGSLGAFKNLAVPEPDKRIETISFANDGKLILLQESSISIWDESYEQSSKVVFSKDSSFTAINYHPKMDSILLGNKKAKVFTMSTDGTIVKGDGRLAHTGKINDIAISPDGHIIATGGNDGVVIWNADKWNGKHYSPMPLRDNSLLNNQGQVFVSTVSFSDDGNYVIAGYNDGLVLNWPVSSDFLEELICKNVHRSLSDEELKTLLNDVNLESEYDCK